MSGKNILIAPDVNPRKCTRRLLPLSSITPPASGIVFVRTERDTALRRVGKPDIALAVDAEVEEPFLSEDARHGAFVVGLRPALEAKAHGSGLVVEEGCRWHYCAVCGCGRRRAWDGGCCAGRASISTWSGCPRVSRGNQDLTLYHWTMTILAALSQKQFLHQHLHQ